MANIFKNIGETISSTAKNVIFQCKQHSPEILLVGSVVLAGAAIVTACVQTMKLDKIVDEHKETLDKINELKNDETAQWEDKKGNRHPYDEKTVRNDKICAYRHYAWNLVKNYWLPTTLFVGSVACGIGSYVIMNNRLAAAVTLSNGLLATIAGYRQRVADKIGAEAEEELYFNKSKVKVTQDDGNGNVTESEINIDHAADRPFIFRFNRSTCPELWDKDPEISLAIIKSVEEYVEGMVYERNHGAVITLHEVLKKLKYNVPRVGVHGEEGRKPWIDYLNMGWTPHMEKSLEHETMNGFKHVSFGLERYSDRHNWPTDGDWIIEMNCKLIPNWVPIQ